MWCLLWSWSDGPIACYTHRMSPAPLLQLVCTDAVLALGQSAGWAATQVLCITGRSRVSGASPTVSLSSVKARKALTAAASASSSEGGAGLLAQVRHDARRLAGALILGRRVRAAVPEDLHAAKRFWGLRVQGLVSAPPSLRICTAAHAADLAGEGCWLLAFQMPCGGGSSSGSCTNIHGSAPAPTSGSEVHREAYCNTAGLTLKSCPM